MSVKVRVPEEHAAHSPRPNFSDSFYSLLGLFSKRKSFLSDVAIVQMSKMVGDLSNCMLSHHIT